MYRVTHYTQVTFRRDEAGAFRLFKPGHLLDDTPADPSDSSVVIKGMVDTRPGRVLVGIPVPRDLLEWEGLEEFLERKARAVAQQYVTVSSRLRADGQ